MNAQRDSHGETPTPSTASPREAEGDDQVVGSDFQTGTFAVAASRSPYEASLHEIANTAAVIAVDVSFLRDRLESASPDVLQTLDELFEAANKLRVLLDQARRQVSRG